MKNAIELNAVRKRLLALSLFVGALTACGGISAQPAGGNGGPPPAEALQACKSLSSGQECSFSSSQGTSKGTCWAPEGRPLACKPKDAPTDQSKPQSK